MKSINFHGIEVSPVFGEYKCPFGCCDADGRWRTWTRGDLLELHARWCPHAPGYNLRERVFRWLWQYENEEGNKNFD